MYSYKIIDHVHAVVEVILGGLMTLEEGRQACDDLRKLLVSVRGRRFRILADARGLQPLPPDVAEAFRSMQEDALAAGLCRVAQVVESSVITLQRNRIAREAGTFAMTRSFRDRDEALRWLIATDDDA